MVILKIDDETFETWNRQARARGLTVEEWLKATTAPVRIGQDQSIDPAMVRLKKFDVLTRTMSRMKIGSGGALDDSRETIYSDRGL
ncbi:hypothetical protein Pan44_52830 [Caulifigura coniformis]|uniref:Uncharacterized protein n=1 Tax=Caulifigura coniformis TaxID=2527983 RepID=A0A517SM60_9PLAN|nr:hypothetical protein [Caulifigura coniformis]QDT57216.1 hypothetical protein Pan44_52830 [Caulifigura coniformis]